MLTPVRFAVVGEGPDEHGISSRGPLLRPLPENSLWGGLVVLVARLLRERYRRAAIPVGWLAPVPNRYSPPPSAVELLCSESLLPRLLDSLLRPVGRSPESGLKADLVVLSVDFERERAFKKAVGRVPQELQSQVISLVFAPEFEVVFTRSKEPLEAACRLEPLSSEPPGQTGDLKKCLERWLQRYAGARTLDAKLREEVARHLNVRPNSPLEDVQAFQDLVKGLAEWKV